MITKKNFKAVIESLDVEDIVHAMYVETSDRIAVYCSNFGGAFIIAWDGYEDEEDVLSTGGFITDKDNFLIMCKDVGIDMEEIIDNYSGEEEDPVRRTIKKFRDSYYDPYNF